MSFFALIDLISKGPSPPWKPGVITTSQFNEEVTRIHNEYRRRHRAYPLRLTEELCTHAQNWAETLLKSPDLTHSGIRYKGTRLAENISMKWSPDKQGYTPQEICDQWYNENRTFEFGKEPTTLTAGHFTNMVWHNSVEIGVGKAQSPDGKCIVVICYFPPGNVIGEFTVNVKAPLDAATLVALGERKISMAMT